MLSYVLAAAVDEQVLVNDSHLFSACFAFQLQMSSHVWHRLSATTSTKLIRMVSNIRCISSKLLLYCVLYFVQYFFASFILNLNFFQFTVYQSKLVESQLTSVLGTSYKSPSSMSVVYMFYCFLQSNSLKVI